MTNEELNIEMPQKSDLWTETRLSKLQSICQTHNITDARIVTENAQYLVEVIFLDVVVGVTFTTRNEEEADEYLKMIQVVIEKNKKVELLHKTR